MKNKVIAFLAIVCLVLISLFWPGKDENIAKDADKKEAQEVTKAETESLARNVILCNQDGEDIKIRDLYNEKPVYLLFWMPWSELCLNQLDNVEAIYQQYEGRVYFVILSSEGHEADIQSIIKKRGYDLPFYYADMSVLSEYNVSEVPQSVMISRYGQIHERHQGVLTEKELAYMIERGER